jgi:hypothetical protein
MPIQKKSQTLPLSYESPLVAVFMRTLAWEIHEAGRNKDERGDLAVKEIVGTQVQTAREDLGFKPDSQGSPHSFLQKLRPKFLTENPTKPTKHLGWEDKDKVWRLFYAPSHRFVRMLSHNPIEPKQPSKNDKTGFVQMSLRLRAPASPTLIITIGVKKPKPKEFEGTRGVYFLRQAKELYVGQSEEFSTRWTGHQIKGVKWWVFISPVEHEGFSLDSLNAAEALLISFWNEVCVLSNRQRGKDKKPSWIFLQQAILLVEAASAAMLWLMRKHEFEFTPWTLPFKPMRARQGRHWPECYLKPFNNSPRRKN